MTLDLPGPLHTVAAPDPIAERQTRLRLWVWFDEWFDGFQRAAETALPDPSDPGDIPAPGATHRLLEGTDPVRFEGGIY
jgi:hypothetical protein